MKVFWILVITVFFSIGCNNVNQSEMTSKRDAFQRDLNPENSDRFASNDAEKGFPLNWISYPNASSYKLLVSSDESCTDVIKEEITTSNDFNLQINEEGRYFVCIFAIVGDEEIKVNKRTIELILDLTPPQVGGALHYVTKDKVLPQLIIDDLTKVSVNWLQPSKVTISDNYALAPEIAAIADGKYEILLNLSDEAGNKSQVTIYLIWNSNLPDNFSSQRINSPSNLITEGKNQSIELRWDAGSSSDIGYLLVRSTDDGIKFRPTNGLLYATKDLEKISYINIDNRTSLKDNGLSNEATYFYHLYAYDSLYRYSEVVKAKDKPNPLDYKYSFYRFQILSALTDCDDVGATEIQNLEFYFDGEWHNNDFRNISVGNVGNQSATVSSSAIDSVEFSPFYALSPSTEAWSSRFGSISLEQPYDVLEDTYVQINFRNGPIKIEGMRVKGGEPGYEYCAPDKFKLLGSDDGSKWLDIPGSAKENQDISMERKTYFFSPITSPLRPSDTEIIAYSTEMYLKWIHAGGPETQFMVVRGTSPITFKPVNGQAYSVGVAGANQIVSIGADNYAYDSGIAQNTMYYYAIFSKTANNIYSAPALLSRETAAPQAFRFYRFVVDSIRGDNFETSTEIETLIFQIDGFFDDEYDFSDNTDVIGGKAVTITASSEMDANTQGWHAFSINDYWNSLDGEYSDSKFPFNTLDQPEYIQLTFATPIAITGYFVYNSGITIESFYRAPDAFHMEGSNNGTVWTLIQGSQGAGNLVEPVVKEW